MLITSIFSLHCLQESSLHWSRLQSRSLVAVQGAFWQPFQQRAALECIAFRERRICSIDVDCSSWYDGECNLSVGMDSCTSEIWLSLVGTTILSLIVWTLIGSLGLLVSSELQASGVAALTYTNSGLDHLFSSVFGRRGLLVNPESRSVRPSVLVYEFLRLQQPLVSQYGSQVSRIHCI